MPKSRSRRKPPPRQRPAGAARREPLVKQPAPGVRGEVERMSAPVLLYLSSRPKFVVPVLSAALLIGGLFAPPGVGLPLLLLLFALVGWLTYLSWPVVGSTARLLRVAVLGLVLAAAAGKLA